MFIEEHYPDIFEETITVSNSAEKGAKISEIAERENVQLEDRELVEDTFTTLLGVMGDGIKVTHISQIVAD